MCLPCLRLSLMWSLCAPWGGLGVHRLIASVCLSCCSCVSSDVFAGYDWLQPLWLGALCLCVCQCVICSSCFSSCVSSCIALCFFLYMCIFMGLVSLRAVAVLLGQGAMYKTICASALFEVHVYIRIRIV